MKLNTTQLTNQTTYVNYKNSNTVEDKMTHVLASPEFKVVEGFLRRCFLSLCLKGNRKSLTFLLPFHFAKKEGVLC